MNENKWPRVSSIVSMILETQKKQMELIEILITTLTDEDDDGSKMEANEKVLERG